MKKANLLFRLSFLMIALLLVSTSYGQRKKKTESKCDSAVASSYASLSFRSVGPAFTSGRIADIAVNPNNHSEYYVAVASGHLWKTVNNGTTWKPIFDKHGAYSMGCITIDPTNSNVIWLGTGENNHQRALGYGNGVWKSLDGGESWQLKGLKDSRQIGKICIDPTDSDIVYVAAEGSAWGDGGDRGLYKTTNGGQTWECVLEVSEHTGINNIVLDPRDSQVIYATSEQRRRRNFTKIGGGPESRVYKSVDGGATWKKIMNGLPGGDIGGMGIAISPINPDYIFLIAEAEGESGGFFRSTNRGASWEKMSDHHSSGQYYNEIYCDPIDIDKIFSVETITHFTLDGGKTWETLSNNGRHVDDHALWIDPSDTEHIMIGGDGGLYESFDAGKNYIFKCNLPVTQFYRVAVDNSEPFYWVYGGTQDNNSLGGPSQNICRQGVASSEWIATVGGDGFFQAVDPVDPNIVYSEYQYGNIFRYDKRSGQKLKIKPEPALGEETFRWNWDAPFILSKHSEKRLYMGANKLFKSDNRGNSWETLSGDLTRNEDRNQFKVMGKHWPNSAVAKDLSTSQWGTIVAIAESPIKSGLLIVGTDDGVIQVTEDDGTTWRKITTFPGVPDYTYVSDILASKVDENVIFVSFDNIKSDDFKPYILKSSDLGASWESIANNLPEDQTVLCLEQDSDDKDVLFLGTEFAVFFSTDGGAHWNKFFSGIPDVKICDMTIQEREKDLVVATFGRGIYILGDYTPLLDSNRKLSEKVAAIYPVKDALVYVQTSAKYGQGATPYFAKNPDFGAQIRYYLDTVPKTEKQNRLALEKRLLKEGKPVPIPSAEQLMKEENEEPPVLQFTIRDSQGEVVRQFLRQPAKGLQSLTWNLRYRSLNPIDKKKFDAYNEGGSGMFVVPGAYSIEMALVFEGVKTPLVGATPFNVVALDNETMPADKSELLAYQADVSELARVFRGAQRYTNQLETQVASIRQALQQDPESSVALKSEAHRLATEINAIQFKFYGTKAGASWEEVPPEQTPLNHRMGNIAWSHHSCTMFPTETNLSEYEILKAEFSELLEEITVVGNGFDKLVTEVEASGAVWTPGQQPKLK